MKQMRRRRSPHAVAGSTSAASESHGQSPGTISGIREHTRRRGRFIIDIDDQLAAVVSVETVAELALHVGQSVGAEIHRALLLADRRTALLDKALNVLAVHARSARELRRRLQRAEAEERDIDWVIERLTSLGYLDDATYARQVARSRIVGAGASKRAVRNELYRRGVPTDVAIAAIDATLADANIDEYGAALAAAGKRMRSLTKLEPMVRKRRLYAFLARRGYELAIIRRVVHDVVLAEQGSAGVDPA